MDLKVLGEIPERGGDSTIEVLSIVNEFESSEGKDILQSIKSTLYLLVLIISSRTK